MYAFGMFLRGMSDDMKLDGMMMSLCEFQFHIFDSLLDFKIFNPPIPQHVRHTLSGNN